MYLLWSNEPMRYLTDAIEGMATQSYPREAMEFLIVYNSHKPDEPSAAPYIRSEIEKNAARLPHTTIIESEKNLGFSGGNNFGMRWAVEHGFDYVFLHNGDAYMGENCVKALVETMDADETIGSAQSLVLLHPATDSINSAGNCLHFLGFGYCDLYKKKKNEVVLPAVKDVAYASGAAIMMRTTLLQKYGYWDEDYFMYHEDTDYSLRLFVAGYRNVMVTASEFFHKYEFSKSISKYFWMERNRYAILLLFFSLPTLILILPMFLIMEIALWFFAWRGGWAGEKWKVYKYWFKLSSWKFWLVKRKSLRAIRKTTDRKLLQAMIAVIKFQEAAIENPVLKYIGNPVMSVYYWILSRMLVWW